MLHFVTATKLQSNVCGLQLKRKKIHKNQKYGFKIRTFRECPWSLLIADMKWWDLEIALLGSGLAVVQYFLIVPQFLPSVMGMRVLHHCIMDICNLCFDIRGAYS